MRDVVAGQRQTNSGVQSIQVWFRFPAPSPARAAYYAAIYAGYQPQAPGSYASPSGPDFPEIAAFQAGSWIEQAGFQDVIDPSSSATQIEGRLLNIWAAAATARAGFDNAALVNWGSGHAAGGTWTMLSA